MCRVAAAAGKELLSRSSWTPSSTSLGTLLGPLQADAAKAHEGMLEMAPSSSRTYSGNQIDRISKATFKNSGIFTNRGVKVCQALAGPCKQCIA